MQKHKKLSARMLSAALAVTMACTALPATALAAIAEQDTTGVNHVGTIISFNSLEERFTPSAGQNSSDHVYSLAVKLDTPFEELQLPDELEALVERVTTIKAPVEDEEIEAPDQADEPVDDTPVASTSNSEKDSDEEDITLFSKSNTDNEIAVITTELETIPVTWNTTREYRSDENGKFIYTAILPEGYALTKGLKLPQIYVFVGRQARSGGTSAEVGTKEAFTNAVSAASSGDTIKLNADIEMGTSGVTITDKSLTLDLNGFTLSSERANVITCKGTTSLTIVDEGSGDGMITTFGISTVGLGQSAIKNQGSGDIIVESGEVNTTVSTDVTISNEGAGAVRVTGGLVSAKDGTAIGNTGTGSVNVFDGGTVSTALRVAIQNTGDGPVNILGGNVSSTGTLSSGYGIKNDGTGNVIVTSGNVSSTGTGIQNNNTGSVEISGGCVSVNGNHTRGIVNDGAGCITITNGEVSAAGQVCLSLFNSGTGTLIVSSGIITATGYGARAINNSGTGATVEISGGTISATAAGVQGDPVRTIVNNGTTCTVTISGGTVSVDNAPSGSSALYNDYNRVPAGNIEVSGGTVSSSILGGHTVVNVDRGEIKISGGTVTSSGLVGKTISNNGAGSIMISGGEVTATGTFGTAVTNAYGDITVFGGTVAATDPEGAAIVNESVFQSGLITIKQDSDKETLVTSAATGGTIVVHSGEEKLILDIQGGTISNTGDPESYSVYFKDKSITYENLGIRYKQADSAKVGKVYPEKPSGGGSSSGGSSSSDSSASYLYSLPANYKGATKIINNIIVPEYVVEGKWVQEAEGIWKFNNLDGISYTDTWIPAYNPYANVKAGQPAFQWFLFDKNGYLVTGWHTDDQGITYYLNTISNNTLGSMVTGWVQINGKYYYFNDEPDGTRGMLYRNTTTPDGYFVDEAGVWNGITN